MELGAVYAEKERFELLVKEAAAQFYNKTGLAITRVSLGKPTWALTKLKLGADGRQYIDASSTSVCIEWVNAEVNL